MNLENQKAKKSIGKNHLAKKSQFGKVNLEKPLGKKSQFGKTTRQKK